MNHRYVLNIDKRGRATVTLPALERITQRAAAVAAARADEAHAEIAAAATSARRTIGQPFRWMGGKP